MSSEIRKQILEFEKQIVDIQRQINNLKNQEKISFERAEIINSKEFKELHSLFRKFREKTIYYKIKLVYEGTVVFGFDVKNENKIYLYSTDDNEFQFEKELSDLKLEKEEALSKKYESVCVDFGEKFKAVCKKFGISDRNLYFLLL